MDLYFHIKDSLTRTDRQDKLHVWVQYSADSLEWTDWMGRELTFSDEAPSYRHTGFASQASYPYDDILYHFYKFKIIIDVGQSNVLLLHELAVKEKEYISGKGNS